jgi:hypothetical protein
MDGMGFFEILVRGFHHEIALDEILGRSAVSRTMSRRAAVRRKRRPR